MRTPAPSWLESDTTIDEAARADLIHQIGQALVDDHVMVPLFQFPNIAAWRTDRIEGDAPSADAANYRAFNNSSHLWTPLSDSGEIIVGAEQWPECINPVTECANSSWMVWTTSFAVLPAVWDTTSDGGRSSSPIWWQANRPLRSTSRSTSLFGVPASSGTPNPTLIRQRRDEDDGEVHRSKSRMGYPGAPDRHIPDLLGGQIGDRPGAELPPDQYPSHSRDGRGVQGQAWPDRLDTRAVRPLARQLRHPRVGQLDQGEPPGLARPQGRRWSTASYSGSLQALSASRSGSASGSCPRLRQYSKFDTAATGAAFVGISMPPFVSAVLLQVFFAIMLTSWLNLDKPFLPVAGVYPPGQTEFDLWLRAKHMILPVTVVAIQIIAVYSRYMRASLLDVKESDYMRTARAKGISERKVVMHHALRNAMIPVVTVAAIDFGAIVGGLIITERIFEFRGTGDYLLTALGQRRLPPDHAADVHHRELGHHLQPPRRRRLRLARPEDPPWLTSSPRDPGAPGGLDVPELNELEGIPIESASPTKLALRRYRHHRAAMISSASCC